MPKAYSYIRFSTPEQAQGDSLRRQLSAAETWCTARGLSLDNTLRDLGVSAYRGANRITGALKSFLDLVESGQVARGSYLIVESLDRLSRETVLDAATRLFALIQAGITVVTLSDGQEYSVDRLRNDWTPLIISLAVMARAHDESRMKSERVGQAWRQKKEEARTDRRPLTPRCPSWLELRNGKFVERPERVEIVRRVFRETIEGVGRREIVRRLNADGVPTFRSGEKRVRAKELGVTGWQTSTIGKIQKSRAVLGEYQPHKGTHKQRNRQPDGEPIKDFYPRIVDDATYWRAQAAIQGRLVGAAGRKGKTVHLLQGLARCASCGSPMHIVNKGKPPKGSIYLACSGNIRSTGCANGRRWRVDRLEHDLLTGLGFVDAEAFRALDDDSGRANELVAALKAQIDEKTATRKRLLKIVTATEDEEATEAFEVVAAELKVLRSDLKAAEAEAAKSAADPGIATRLRDIAVLSHQIEDTDAEERRALRIRLLEILRSVVDQIECGTETGAVMTLKPRRGGYQMVGTVPFAIRMQTVEEATGTPEDENRLMELRMVLEEDDEAIAHFFGDIDFEDE